MPRVAAFYFSKASIARPRAAKPFGRQDIIGASSLTCGDSLAYMRNALSRVHRSGRSLDRVSIMLELALERILRSRELIDHAITERIGPARMLIELSRERHARTRGRLAEQGADPFCKQLSASPG